MLEPLTKIPNKKILHQLNNEGCVCEMCQKIIIRQNKQIKLEKICDQNSQQFNPNASKEYYIKIVKQLIHLEKKTRKLRYLLPEICIYSHATPIERIAKKKQKGGLIQIRDSAKMHMFQIIHFFLQGFIFHKNIPQKTDLQLIINKKGRRKGKKTKGEEDEDQIVGIYSQKHKNSCIVVAKYRNNFFNMFTLNQMESLFKSRQKYLREGLMYIQTLIDSDQNAQIRINIDLRSYIGKDIYERAKNEARIILEEVKSSDMDYILEEEELDFEEELKQKNFREYLEYLSLKIILLHSRNKELIISKAVFKYVSHRKYYYIWDVRVEKMENSDEFWAAGMIKAFELRLHKRMSMMDFQKHKEEVEPESTRKSYRVKNIQQWLQNSTSIQWSEMKLIKNRLQRLQKQKKSLMQSQSFAEGDTRSMFKVRNLKK